MDLIADIGMLTAMCEKHQNLVICFTNTIQNCIGISYYIIPILKHKNWWK